MGEAFPIFLPFWGETTVERLLKGQGREVGLAGMLQPVIFGRGWIVAVLLLKKVLSSMCCCMAFKWARRVCSSGNRSCSISSDPSVDIAFYS